MELTRREWLASAGSLLAATSSLSLVLPLSDRGRKVIAVGGPAFGSYWHATVPSAIHETAVRSQIQAIIDALDQSMSPFRTGTEISRFNAMKSTRLFPASGPLQSVVAESLRIAGLSGGAFDPTVGPLVNRYGFGPIRGDARANFADIAIGNGTLSKATPDVTLDLCGIAKGYALQEIATALDTLGVQDFVVELGGEVFARGSHPNGRPWRIAIEAPLRRDSPAQRIVHLSDLSLATSGDRASSYTYAGRRYSHIMDTRRSAPVDGSIASVSVIAPSAMQADAFATTIIALGPRRGVEFASRHDIPTLLLLRDGKGIHELVLPGFREHISV
jgi:thiamine biosynthesis lipoprotein